MFNQIKDSSVPIKLHIGCGTKNLPGWKHFDIRKIDDHIDCVGTAGDLLQFADNSISEIYACHLLEHFGRHQVDAVLAEWSRFLTDGGVLHIAVPDFEAIIAEYGQHKDLPSILGLLYGGQNYEYNFHYICFDFSDLRTRLEKAGFTQISRYDWREFLPKDYDDFSRAYLPHMDFENGRLMSLNVVAKKA